MKEVEDFTKHGKKTMFLLIDLQPGASSPLLGDSGEVSLTAGPTRYLMEYELAFARVLIDEQLAPDEEAARQKAAEAQTELEALEIAIGFEKLQEGLPQALHALSHLFRGVAAGTMMQDEEFSFMRIGLDI